MCCQPAIEGRVRHEQLLTAGYRLFMPKVAVVVVFLSEILHASLTTRLSVPDNNSLHLIQVMWEHDRHLCPPVLNVRGHL